jgi:serine O-acetyltransferase
MINKNCKEYIRSDFARFGFTKLTLSLIFRLFISQPTFRYLTFYRICSFYSKKHILGIFSRLWLLKMKTKFGLQLFLKATIGKGFCLNHYGNILIGQGVTIGENCNVGQGVSIGNVSRGKLKGSPTIGNRVWIGPNAVVVGNITIGNDVLIAPLTYVNQNIPAKAVVSGNPFKIHNYNGSEVYVKNLYEPQKEVKIN